MQNETQIILWAMGGGFAGTWMMMFWMVKSSNQSINQRIDQIDRKIDRVQETVTDLDRRVCRLEGAFSSKEFCGLRNQEHRDKAE